MGILSEWPTIQELSDFALRPILLTSPVLDALRKSKITQLDTKVLLWHTPIDGRWEC
jgi:hypothetical protein